MATKKREDERGDSFTGGAGGMGVLRAALQLGPQRRQSGRPDGASPTGFDESDSSIPPTQVITGAEQKSADTFWLVLP
jgi:hypothetical protein